MDVGRTKAADVIRLMNKIEAAWKKKMGAETMDIYVSSLSRFSYEELSRAVQEAIDKCKFFPKVAEIIGFVGRGVDRQTQEPRHCDFCIDGWHHKIRITRRYADGQKVDEYEPYTRERFFKLPIAWDDEEHACSVAVDRVVKACLCRKGMR